MTLSENQAVLCAWENCCLVVPKGQARIAQRFNAGLHVKKSRVPKGRPRSHSTHHHSAVPSGLVCLAGDFPALKRRAILKTSLRDKGRRRPDYPPITQPNSLAVLSRAFPGLRVAPARFGKRSSLAEREQPLHPYVLTHSWIRQSPRKPIQMDGVWYSLSSQVNIWLKGDDR